LVARRGTVDGDRATGRITGRIDCLSNAGGVLGETTDR
jgi:hypothetical protein